MTEQPQIIRRLGDIADQYDALFCDVWGVIHNGHQAFEASIWALEQFRANNGPVILITNSPRPSSQIPAQLDQIGVSHDCYDAIITSGDATRAALQARAPGAVYALGPDRDLYLYEGIDLQFTGLQDAGFISCTGLVDDHNETPADYDDLLAEAAALNLPMVCANPDIEVMIGSRRIWCGGALAIKYQQMGGDVLYAGKPHQPIYDLCFKALAEISGKRINRDKILAIGDGIGTDIKGAQAAGIDALFVATGIHVASVDEAGNIDGKKLFDELTQQKTRARFGAPGLIW